MFAGLERTAELSVESLRIRLDSDSLGNVVMFDGVPFSGFGYVPNGIETYKAVQVIDGVVADAVDDPLLPVGPFVDLSVEENEPDWDPDTLDWWHRGQPFTGWSISFDGCFVDRVEFVDESTTPVEIFEFARSGVVVNRLVDQRFDPPLADGLQLLRQRCAWSPSGIPEWVYTRFSYAGKRNGPQGSFSSDGGELRKVSVTGGYYDAIVEYEDKLLLPYLNDVTAMNNFESSRSRFSFGLGDRSEGIVESLLSNGLLDRVECFRMISYEGGMAGLRRLIAAELPSLREFDVVPSDPEDELEVFELLRELKQRDPSIEVSMKGAKFVEVSELSDDSAYPSGGFYFGKGFEDLIGLNGWHSRSARLAEWVCSTESLRFLKVTSRGTFRDPKNTELFSELDARPDVQLFGPDVHPKAWVPAVVERLP